MSLADRLHGLGPLLRSKRPFFKPLFLATLVISLGLGLGMRLGLIPHLDRGMIPVLVVAITLIGPLAMGGEETLSASPDGRTRREALLAAGPIGPWAIPAAIHLGSLLMIGGVFLSLLPALLLFDGIPGAKELAVSGFTGLWVWALFCFIAAAGNNAANGLSLLCIVPLLWALAPIAIGHGEEAFKPILAWIGGLMLAIPALFLVLPYVLYARPIHHWEATIELKKTRRGEVFVFFAALGACLAPFVGLLWSLPVFALAGGIWLAGRRRQATVRRPLVTNFSYGLRLSLMVLSPFFLLGPLGDAYGYRLQGRYDAELHKYGYEAPAGGRKVVLLAKSVQVYYQGKASEPPPRLEAHESMGRAAVIDADGQVQFVFPQRFAVLERFCWSSDGRYVAAHDQTLGNLQLDLPKKVERMRREGVSKRLERLLKQNLQTTVVFDTHTGEVRTLPFAELGSGWRTPDDLVIHTLGLQGQHVLRDGQGRAAETQEADVRFHRYTDQGPLFWTSSGLAFLTKEGLVPRRP